MAARASGSGSRRRSRVAGRSSRSIPTAASCTVSSRAATPSAFHGFWEVDGDSPGRRWYRLYSFLSETYLEGRPNGSDIASDVQGSAGYLKKIRFSPIGDLYPHPAAAPFVDDQETPTYEGDYSHRPNPEWFRSRTDLAVRTAFEQDLIADLIMSAGTNARQDRVVAELPAR